MNYHVASDEELVGRLGESDARALEVLYDRYSRPVYSLALRILRNPSLAEEVVQEVFLKLWRQPTRFIPDRGRFDQWLLSVTHNRAIDQLRANRAELTLEYSDFASGFDVLSEEVDPADLAWYREERDRVRGALSQLPDSQRHAIELAYFGGLTQSQIATMTGEPLGTVKTRIRLGMQKLRTLLTEHRPRVDSNVEQS